MGMFVNLILISCIEVKNNRFYEIVSPPTPKNRITFLKQLG